MSTTLSRHVTATPRASTVLQKARTGTSCESVRAIAVQRVCTQSVLLRSPGAVRATVRVGPRAQRVAAAARSAALRGAWLEHALRGPRVHAGPPHPRRGPLHRHPRTHRARAPTQVSPTFSND